MRSRLGKIAVKDCVPTPDNKRVFDEKDPDFQALARDVKADGVRVPVHARPHPTKQGGWDLRCGERRLAAAKLAGLEEIPAIIYDGMTDDEALKLTFKENFDRKDLKPIEEAAMVADLLAKEGSSLESVAKFCGRSVRWVALRAKLLDLAPEWRKAAVDEANPVHYWKNGCLELIARFDKDAQLAMLKDGLSRDLALPVTPAKLEKHIQTGYIHALKSAPWDPADVELEKGAGACLACPKRSSSLGVLFAEAREDARASARDRCLDARCWEAKMLAFARRRLGELKQTHPGILLEFDGPSPGYRSLQMVQEQLGVEQIGHLYDYMLAKSEKDARPVMVAWGPNAGKLVWIKKESVGDRTRAPKPKVSAMPLKERRVMLDRKRDAEFVRLTGEKLAALGITSLPFGGQKELHPRMSALTAVFGAIGCESSPGPICAVAPGKVTPTVDMAKPFASAKSLAADPAAVSAILWNKVRPVILRRISWQGPLSQIPEVSVREAEAVCEFFGLPAEELRSKAVEAYPEPKSWTKK